LSTDYIPLIPISAVELFDGRLLLYGVYEHIADGTSETARCLTDGCGNCLWVYLSETGMVDCFTRYFPSGNPSRILAAIADQFDVDIVSEYEPQFWGFQSQEEWDEAWEKLAREDEEEFCQDVLRYIAGDANIFTPGTVGRLKADDIKKQVEADSGLLAPENREKLREMIGAVYHDVESYSESISLVDLM
jgi:hypothetical protein